MDKRRKYWIMTSEVVSMDPLRLHPIRTHEPRIECTVAAVSGWIDKVYPDMELTFPAVNGYILPDAVKAMDLYGFLQCYTKDSNGKRYEIRFVEC